MPPGRQADRVPYAYAGESRAFRASVSAALGSNVAGLLLGHATSGVGLVRLTSSGATSAPPW